MAARAVAPAGSAASLGATGLPEETALDTETCDAFTPIGAAEPLPASFSNTRSCRANAATFPAAEANTARLATVAEVTDEAAWHTATSARIADCVATTARLFSPLCTGRIKRERGLTAPAKV